MTKSCRLLHTLFIGLLLCVSGCTHNYKIAVKPTQLPAGVKLPYNAALVLHKDMADYKYEMHLMGDKFVYPLGGPLNAYALRTTEASFQKIQTVPNAEQISTNSDINLVLTARPLKADQSVGVWAWNKNSFVLVVEWSATDLNRRNTVWLKTITAEATETGGNAFTAKKHRNVMFQKLFDDLSLKTHAAFQEAQELRTGLK